VPPFRGKKGFPPKKRYQNVPTEISFHIGMVNTKRYRPIPTGKYRFDVQLYCGRGRVLSRNLLAGKVCFCVFAFPENKPVDTASIVSANSYFMSCRRRPWSAKKIRVIMEKISDLKYQTWATDSSYVGQVHVRVRVKVRVNTKKWKISTYRGTSISTSLQQDFLSLRLFR
jgi:hypothetical protein